MAMDLLAVTKERFEHLNEVAAARPYLEMGDRDVELRIEGHPAICLRVQGGRISVTAGTAELPKQSVVQGDEEVWSTVMAAKMTFTEAGGGMGGRLKCIRGLGSYMHMSWLGIVTRLAQEHR